MLGTLLVLCGLVLDSQKERVRKSHLLPIHVLFEGVNGWADLLRKGNRQTAQKKSFWSSLCIHLIGTSAFIRSFKISWSQSNLEGPAMVGFRPGASSSLDGRFKVS